MKCCDQLLINSNSKDLFRNYDNLKIILINKISLAPNYQTSYVAECESCGT